MIDITQDRQLSPHFQAREFRCKCGRKHPQEIEEMLIFKLEQIRTMCGNRVMRINSAYRCSDWNKQIGGEKDSQHLLGYAADIVVEGVSPILVGLRAASIGLSVGVYQSFTHVDTRKATAFWVEGF